MVFVTKGYQDSRSKRRDKGGKRADVKCYNCGKAVHFKRDCPERKSNADNQEGASGRPNIGLVLSGKERSEHWIVDSGASKHTCCRRDWFATFSPSNEKL